MRSRTLVTTVAAVTSDRPDEFVGSHGWRRSSTMPSPQTWRMPSEDEDVSNPPWRMPWQQSMPAEDVSEGKNAPSLLENVLETCEERLNDLQQGLQCSGPTPEWTTSCQTLRQVLEDLAGEALDAACQRGAGAMDVFEGANSALSTVVGLIKQADEASYKSNVPPPSTAHVVPKLASQQAMPLLQPLATSRDMQYPSLGSALTAHVQELCALQAAVQAGEVGQAWRARSQALLRALEELSSEAMILGDSDLFSDADAATRALTSLLHADASGNLLPALAATAPHAPNAGRTGQPDVFSSGTKVLYNSTTYGGWVVATVVRFDPGSGCYDLDVRKGAAADALRPWQGPADGDAQAEP